MSVEQWYSPPDMDVANAKLGAFCGHGALAAALGFPVFVAIVHVGKKGWMNMPDMERAIRAAGASFQYATHWPTNGVTMIQWEGPWTKPNVPPRVRCMHRHWIAVRERHAWDSNLQEWMTLGEWAEFAEELMPDKATGWTIARSYEITKGSK